MGAVALGQERETGAVDIDAGEMDVIRVLILVVAHDAQSQVAGFCIEMIDGPHDPVTLGDRADQLARGRVEAVEVIVSGALGHPDDLAPIVEDVQVGLVGVVDECVARFLDDDPGLACLGIDSHDAQRLVAALVVEVVEGAGIGCPLDAVDAPGVADGRVAELDLAEAFC